MLTLRHRRNQQQASVASQPFQTAYREMSALTASNNWIAFTTRGTADPPTEYTIELRITSPCAIGRNATPTNARVFRLNVRLPARYPASAPQCRVAADSPTPFHPHFTPHRVLRRSRWVDYRPASGESLASFILRVAKSLQYAPEYIDASASRIANPRALKWYSLAKLQHPDWFPTDRAHVASSPHSGAAPRTLAIMGSTPEGSPRQQKRFQIASMTPAYEVKVKALEASLRELAPRSNTSGNAEHSHSLYVLPRAYAELTEHIEWGRTSARNSIEQGGLLLGHVYSDPEHQKIYGVVESVIPGDRAKGSGAYLLMDHETWKEMLDQLDRLNAARTTEPMQVIGWYHTHPNELSVFLSGTDRATQARMFSQPWQFAVVLNPQKKLWRVFHGADSVECVGFVTEATT